MAYSYFDEVYANGDGTDSWCSTNGTVPVDIYAGKVYSTPLCDIWSCTLGDFEKGLVSQIVIVQNEAMSLNCLNGGKPTRFQATLMYIVCV